MLRSLGAVFLFSCRAACAFPSRARDWKAIVRQLYYQGVLTVPIILMAGIFFGFVITLMVYYSVVWTGNEGSTARFVMHGFLRELGPVMAALLYVGRAGSSMTAEIGSMKITEQLVSMDVMGVDVRSHVLFPRFWSSFLALPLLTMLFCLAALFSCYCYSVFNLGVDPGLFWGSLNEHIFFSIDSRMLLSKTLIFSFVCTTYSLYFGFNVKPTPIDLALASTKTVVISSITVLFFDYLLTAYWIGEWLP